MLYGIYINDRFTSPENVLVQLNPIALRKAKTLWSFGLSECKRVK